jgi:hypothetical protein
VVLAAGRGMARRGVVVEENGLLMVV